MSNENTTNSINNANSPNIEMPTAQANNDQYSVVGEEDPGAAIDLGSAALRGSASPKLRQSPLTTESIVKKRNNIS